MADVSRGGNNRLGSRPRNDFLRDQWGTGAGKGSRRRPLSNKFGEEFDRIFGTCEQHPEYQAKRAPTADCGVCRRLWREAQLRGGDDLPRTDGDQRGSGAPDRMSGSRHGESSQGAEQDVASVVPPTECKDKA